MGASWQLGNDSQGRAVLPILLDFAVPVSLRFRPGSPRGRRGFPLSLQFPPPNPAAAWPEAGVENGVRIQPDPALPLSPDQSRLPRPAPGPCPRWGVIDAGDLSRRLSARAACGGEVVEGADTNSKRASLGASTWTVPAEEGNRESDDTETQWGLYTVGSHLSLVCSYITLVWFPWTKKEKKSRR